jgi:prophage regulatory protein
VTASEIMFADQIEGEFNIKASTLRYWASVGEGPPSFKLGRRRVWRRAAVTAWIEQQEKAATTH